jgi:hypothetical protein
LAAQQHEQDQERQWRTDLADWNERQHTPSFFLPSTTRCASSIASSRYRYWFLVLGQEYQTPQRGFSTEIPLFPCSLVPQFRSSAVQWFSDRNARRPSGASLQKFPCSFVRLFVCSFVRLFSSFQICHIIVIKR